MTGEQYRHAIEHLGMSQVGSARFLGVSKSTPRKWISEKHPIPLAVTMLLCVMVAEELSPRHVIATTKRMAEQVAG